METSLYIFCFFAVLLAIQSFASLRDGFRFLRYVRKSMRQPIGDHAPPAAVIIPIKGMHQDFKTNIRSFLTQQYPYYQLILVVENKNDPAFSALNTLIAEASNHGATGPKTASLVVAGASESRGQKVHNLCRGIEAVDPQAEVLVFADADARPNALWLRSLVAPLGKAEVTVSTGFRWYLPGKSFVSRLRAAWDTSIATMLGEHGRNFPWGGSMAIRARDFKQFRVAERYWTSTVSDDYALGRAVQDAKGWVRFEPRCLVASCQDSSFAEFLRWSNRQIIITRVYASRLWRLGLSASLLYSGTLIFALVLLLKMGTNAAEKLVVAVFVAMIVALGMAKGRIRTIVARELFPKELATAKMANCYWQLNPAVPWVMLWNFVTAGFTRRIEWSGIHYYLHSDHEVEITRRETG